MDSITSKTAKQLFGDDEPADTTRDRILDTALDLFYTYGFHQVGLDSILYQVGVTKTTFYNHFESKDALMVAAIQRRDRWEEQTFARMVRERAGFAPRAMLLAMFDVLDEWFNHEDYRGCLFVNACAEFPLRHHPVHKAAAVHYRNAEQTIRQIAEAAGAENPADLAEQLILLIEGAVTHRQVASEDGAAAVARRAAERLLEHHLPAGG